MVLATIVRLTGARRIPLIKFRKGGNQYPGVAAAAANQASASPSAQSYQAPAVSPYAIEDWELPPRYWRKPIDAAEMEYINRGGPA